MKKVAEDNPNAQVLVRAVKFSNGARRHISQHNPFTDDEFKSSKKNPARTLVS